MNENPRKYDLKDFSQSIMGKVLMMGLIMLTLMSPKSMITDLIQEREKRNQEVVAEISSKWGGTQALHGPVLSIPFTQIIDGNKVQKCFNLYPTELTIKGDINPEIRKRSIFNAILYQAQLQFHAQFNLSILKLHHYNFQLDQAEVSFSISDLRGVSHSVQLQINDQGIQAEPGILQNNGLGKGFHFPIDLTTLQEDNFAISADLHLNGSQNISFIPSGKITHVSIKSTWPHPSFNGHFLPKDYSLTDEGFQANWEIHDLQRSFQQSWFENDIPSSASSCGLSLIEVQDTYSQVNRVVKYIILFLGFTFGAMFINERISRQTIHPLQYILVGLASLIFYVLLLSLSEHINFNLAYIITASSTTLLITAYAKGLFKSWKHTLTIGILTGGLYSYLFGTIQLEEYALIMGSAGLFLVLSLVMYFTRDLNRETRPLSNASSPQNG
jgi:inner membrane protein